MAAHKRKTSEVEIVTLMSLSLSAPEPWKSRHLGDSGNVWSAE